MQGFLEQLTMDHEANTTSASIKGQFGGIFNSPFIHNPLAGKLLKGFPLGIQDSITGI